MTPRPKRKQKTRVTEIAQTGNKPLYVIAAFASGGLLTLMVFFNGQLAFHGTPLFASWVAHGTGTIAAIIFLLVLWRRPRSAPQAKKPSAPWWAYLGGLSGALTVMFTSTTVNSALALSGTLALGLAGQFAFGLVADLWGMFGLPKRRPDLRDLTAFALIIAGSAIIIFFALGAR